MTKKGVSAPMDLRALMGGVLSGEPMPVESPPSLQANPEPAEPPAPELAPAAQTSAPPPDVGTPAMVAPRARRGRTARLPADFAEQGNPQIIKQFQLRLPEPMKHKLDWVAKHLVHTSAHELVLEALRERLDKELAQAVERERG